MKSRYFFVIILNNNLVNNENKHVIERFVSAIFVLF